MKKRITISIFCFAMILSCTKDKSNSTSALHSKSVSENIKEHTEVISEVPPQDYDNYWFSGEAEITSFQLEQARYGELRKGKAVLVYVTEDFLPEIQVKADNRNANNISVLKLNTTKTFNTGIYPYSIMQSTFYPFNNNQHAMKVSCSVQEWCGHAYTQLNNRSQFEITSHSYFENEADQKIKLDKTILENEIWTQLRIDPASLPTGDLEVIPALEYIRLKHIEPKAYQAKGTLSFGTYELTYPDLNRSLKINFNNNYPYYILGWEETFQSGFGTNAKTLTTKATKLKTIKSAYWNKNGNADIYLRDTLLLND